MPHGDLAQLSAVIGGLGAAAMLLSRTRAQLLAGVAVAVAGEAALAAALIPAADLKLLVTFGLQCSSAIESALLYEKSGNYEAVARQANLDRRTVKKYLERITRASPLDA